MEICFLAAFCDFVDELFAVFPAEAGVGDGAAVYAFADLLAAFFDVAFDHEAFYQVMNVFGVFAAVEYFSGDTDLFFKLLAGVCVVGVYDAGGIFYVFCCIEFTYVTQE